MEISEERIREFITLYHREYGEEITPEEALKRGLAILQLVKLAHGDMGYH